VTFQKTKILVILSAAVLLWSSLLPVGRAQDTDPLDAFRQRLERTDKQDPAALHELAAWCRKNRLKTQNRQVLELILVIDAGNEKANVELGRVRYRGKWVTPERRKTLIAQRRAERMRSLGFVSHRGAWVTPEEKEMLEKGFVRHEGKWVTPAEKKAAEGDVIEDGRRVGRSDLSLLDEMKRFEEEHKLTTAFYSSEHFAVFSEFGDGYNHNLAERLEAGYFWFEKFFGKTKTADLFGGRRPAALIFDDRKTFDAYVDFFSRFQENMSESWAARARRVLGFAWWDPTCFSVAYKGPREDREVDGQILHQMGHVLVNRKGYNYHFLPPWLDEGVAALFEHSASGHNWAFCIQGRNMVSAIESDDLFSGEGWTGLLDALVLRGIDPDLTDMMVKDLDLLDQDDVAKAMGLVLFLAEEKPGSAGLFLSEIQRRIPRGVAAWDDPGTVQIQHDALNMALSAAPEEIDLAFRAWWAARSAGGFDE
jgi:hypothetical protein